MMLQIDAAAFDAAVERDLARLQRDWPASIELRWTPRSTFDALVSLLLPAFPEVAPEDAQALARFCRLFAGSILLHDRLLDGDIHDREVGVAAMRILAMQHEAYGALHALYPPGAKIWERFRGYVTAYAQAFVEERGFRQGRPLHELTQALGISIATGKHGVAKTIVAALVESTGREDQLEPLCASIDAVAIAFQMHDDLEDWRLDLWTRSPSLLLARLPEAALQRPARDEDWPAYYAQVGRMIYASGAASEMSALALDALERTEHLALPAPWRALIASLTARCRRTLQVLDTVQPAMPRPEAG